MRLAAFEGRWTIARTIEDARAARSGRFEGDAVFVRCTQGLRYREEGRLTLGPVRGARRATGSQAALTATRDYLFRDGGAGTIEVRFADGRLFHRFDPGEDIPRALHDCPPDRYCVRYDFSRWPRWRAEWRVEGPAKDYRIVSDYRAAPGG